MRDMHSEMRDWRGRGGLRFSDSCLFEGLAIVLTLAVSALKADSHPFGEEIDARLPPSGGIRGNAWFRRGTLYRAAIDALTRTERPLTAREMMLAILDGKEPPATRKQELDVQAAILGALRKHQGKGVETIGEGRPVRWGLIE